MRGGGEVDRQIKLLSLCPLKGPAVTSAFVRGRQNDQATQLGFSSWQKRYSKEKR